MGKDGCPSEKLNDKYRAVRKRRARGRRGNFIHLLWAFFGSIAVLKEADRLALLPVPDGEKARWAELLCGIWLKYGFLMGGRQQEVKDRLIEIDWKRQSVETTVAPYIRAMLILYAIKSDLAQPGPWKAKLARLVSEVWQTDVTNGPRVSRYFAEVYHDRRLVNDHV